MRFDLAETGVPSPAPSVEAPPSEMLADALRLYQQERFAYAAVKLQKVVEGRTADCLHNLQKAQFVLGKSLYHLAFYQSALVVFDEITEQGRNHRFFDQTLQWLAQLAIELPEPAGIIDRIGRFDVSYLDSLDNPDNAEVYNRLLYLMGRYQYEQGELERAVRLFAEADPGSRFYARSRFMEGISNVRLRRARPATRAFREIIRAVDEGDAGDFDDADRLRDLAWLSLARIYYAIANQTNDEKRQGALLGNAVEAWTRIQPNSEYWLDSLFESSWALFLADEYARALGNVHTLYSPYFAGAFYPEALVLKAVILFHNCQMESSMAVIEGFHHEYDPIREQLQGLLDQYTDSSQLYKFVAAVETGQAELPPRILGIVASALSDRVVLQNVEYVSLLQREETALKKAAAHFRDSSLGSRILQDVMLARSFAIDQTGDLVKGRYNRLLEEVQELANQMDTIEIEILNFRRDQLKQGEGFLPVIASRAGEVVVDSEHVVWPFNGEYWRDELGYYRQEVTNRCVR